MSPVLKELTVGAMIERQANNLDHQMAAEGRCVQGTVEHKKSVSEYPGDSRRAAWRGCL
jgi:hypothetical protein